MSADTAFDCLLAGKSDHFAGVIMKTSPPAGRQSKKKEGSREVVIATFWDFSCNRNLLKESERLLQIKEGISADLYHAIRVTFDLPQHNLATLLNTSISTLERRRRERKTLDPVASERVDRIAAVCHLAQEVLEGREAATQWLSMPNKSLGGVMPIMHCETEIGAKQVRRILQALEFGGAI
jgi:putative toxin-antitoxin system antitoxin component (TIGR02293 family)